MRRVCFGGICLDGLLATWRIGVWDRRLRGEVVGCGIGGLRMNYICAVASHGLESEVGGVEMVS